jgi:hypothetical protein
MVYWYEAAQVFYPNQNAAKMEMAEFYQLVARDVTTRALSVTIGVEGDQQSPVVTDLHDTVSDISQESLTSGIAYSLGYTAQIEDGKFGTYQSLNEMLEELDGYKLNELHEKLGIKV